MVKRPATSASATRSRLPRVGAEGLSDALLELAEQNDEAAELVGHLTTSPEKKARRYKQQLAALKRQRRFVSRGESGAYARLLGAMLGDLRSADLEPRAGVELVAAFYECDRHVFDHSDDSNGSIGDVFRMDARDTFVHFAARCEDKAWLIERVLQLVHDDDYGIRDSVIEAAGEFLDAGHLRELAERLWEVSAGPGGTTRDSGGRDYERSRRLGLVELVARQLRDPGLFEKARRARHPELGTGARIDIARSYFEAGEARTALSWLDPIPEHETFMGYERDQLLAAVHAQLGNREAVEALAWKKFRISRSLDTLASLLDILGLDRREEVVDGAIGEILAGKAFRSTDAEFLIDSGHPGEAESYVLDRREQLNGDFYSTLLPIAEGLEGEGRFTAASVIYRALLDSILARAVSKYYPYAVRYLRRLDDLAKRVEDWRDVAPHASYFADLRAKHGRKPSFWSRYER